MNRSTSAVVAFVVGGFSVSATLAQTDSIQSEARVVGFSDRYVTVMESRPVQECRDVQVRTGGSTDSDTPELVGAVIGGAIGKQIDDNSKSSTVIGALLGASIASDIEKRNARGSVRTQRECSTVYRETQVQRLDGYDVVYEYQGNLFESVTRSRPGATIPVNVFVLPVDKQ